MKTLIIADTDADGITGSIYANQIYPEALIIYTTPGNAGKVLLANLANFEKFVFVDCTPPLDTKEVITKTNKKLVILDHHQRAGDWLPYLDNESNVVTDNTYCSTELAYMKLTNGPSKHFAKIVGDFDVARDMGNKAIIKFFSAVSRVTDIDEITKVLTVLSELEVDTPEELIKFIENTSIPELQNFKADVRRSYREFFKHVRHACSTMIRLAPGLVEYHCKDMVSLVAHYLANIYKIKGIHILRYENDRKAAQKVSLRAFDKNVDLNLILKPFGGGGHKLAAGAYLKENQLLELIKAINYRDI